jgi:hypothetical protein
MRTEKPNVIVRAPPPTPQRHIMKRSLSRAICMSLVSLIGLAVGWHTIRAGQPAEKPSRREFMRQKLSFAKDVLEGLALEQFSTIEKGGKALKRLSEAADWELATIPSAADYVALTADFQRHADELVKQANARNIDGATLAYVKITMSCVQCHKFIHNKGNQKN